MLALVALFAFTPIRTQNPSRYLLIPYPAKLSEEPGQFVVSKNTRILYAPGSKQEAFTFWREVMPNFQRPIAAGDHSLTGQIEFKLSNKFAPESESYRLDIQSNRIEIDASHTAGLFYGGVTLSQLASSNLLPGQIAFPCVRIADSPAYKWRGLMLDVSRHFRPKPDIERYLKIMAMHKLNTFHWHLVDDGGWRIEIKKYPLLTSRGAWRSTPTTGWSSPIIFPAQHQPGEYGGFYTQNDIREIVAYATKLHITIVPEIEMPGHSLAAITCYPEVACTAPDGSGPVINSNYCPGKEATFTFLDNVLTEVMALFPSKYIHVGGDEVDKSTWAVCPDCQARIKSEGLKNTDELQSYFVKRMEKFLNSHGRRLIGWDEILEGGVAPNAAVMSWRGTDGGIKAVREGHNVVMSPTSNCYFDASYADTPVSKVYAYNPIPPGITSVQAKLILGAQGNLWTERIPTRKHLDEMTWPRAAALSEVVWTPRSEQNWQSFQSRLPAEYQRLSQMGVDYMTPTPVPSVSAIIGQLPQTVRFTQVAAHGLLLKTQKNGGEWIPSDGQLSIKTPGKYSAAFFRPDGSNGPETSIIAVDGSGYSNKSASTPGLKVSYFEGAFTNVPDFNSLTPAFQTSTPNIGITMRKRDENYALDFQGYIHIPTSGTYTFMLSSDDGSWLDIAGARVVDSDGLHSAGFVSGTVLLKSGTYPFRVGYFQSGGAESLDLKVSGPGMTDQPVPDGWFTSI